MAEEIDKATSKDVQQLIEKVNHNMKIAGIINLIIGIITSNLCIALSVLRGFILQGVVSIVLGIIYLYRTNKLGNNAWEHMDVLIILVIINLFFGAFIPAIFIGFALKNRHKINVETNKSYL